MKTILAFRFFVFCSKKKIPAFEHFRIFQLQIKNVRSLPLSILSTFVDLFGIAQTFYAFQNWTCAVRYLQVIIYVGVAYVKILLGWHVYYSYRLFQEKSSLMKWKENSASNSEDHTENMERAIPSVKPPSGWYSNHIWMAKPPFMFAVIGGVEILFLLLQTIDFVTIDTFNGNCPTESPILFIILLLSMIIIIIIFLVKYRALKDMKDGKKTLVFFELSSPNK